MNVYRKPATAEWYYDSAQWVDSQDISRESWSGTRKITFDATKDKTGDRHTTMRVSLSETDVERLCAGLMEGRKKETRLLVRQCEALKKDLRAAKRAIQDHLDEIEELWESAAHDSDAEAHFKRLKDSLEKALDKANRHWRWNW